MLTAALNPAAGGFVFLGALHSHSLSKLHVELFICVSLPSGEMVPLWKQGPAQSS